MTEKSNDSPMQFFTESVEELDWIRSAEESQHNTRGQEPHRVFIRNDPDSDGEMLPRELTHDSDGYRIVVQSLEGSKLAGYLIVEFETQDLDQSDESA